LVSRQAPRVAIESVDQLTDLSQVVIFSRDLEQVLSRCFVRKSGREPSESFRAFTVARSRFEILLHLKVQRRRSAVVSATDKQAVIVYVMRGQ
jgi:hypothetical protein